MKNVVECYKHFYGYFNALETHGGHGLVQIFFFFNKKIAQVYSF